MAIKNEISIEFFLEHFKDEYLKERNEAVSFFSKKSYSDWSYHARNQIGWFCKYIIVCYCGDDVEKAKDILSGKCDFNHVFDKPLEVPPFGTKLLQYVFQIQDVEVQKLRILNLSGHLRKLNEIIHSGKKVDLKFSEIVQNSLNKADEFIQNRFKGGKVENSELGLEKVLKNCKKAAKKGYADAQNYMESLNDAINYSCEEIRNCTFDLQKYQINDEDIVRTVQGQLNRVQEEFRKSYYDTDEKIRIKASQSENFNITLFGKTKVGKSTLMEILTHGDGKSIGKGGQRTTLDVRHYYWRNMMVTDVPGIEAYGGEVDDSLAEQAATYADLILFLITSGQPSKQEADWLVKLKKMDKPIICLCNYWQNLSDPHRIKRFISNPEKLLKEMNLPGLKKQFNEFIQDNLPNENVPILVAQLEAKFLSQSKEHAEYSKELERLSCFSELESSIISEIAENGILHRQKCFLSIIDAPLYSQMLQLLDFSKESYYKYLVISEKIKQFDLWCKSFNPIKKEELSSAVTLAYNRIRVGIPGFVERNLEASDLTEKWKVFSGSYHVENDVNKKIEEVANVLTNKVQTLFKELDEDLKFMIDAKSGKSLGSYGFTNWKKGLGWVSAIGTASGAILGLLGLVSNPVGWGIAIGSLVVGFISWLCDSREDKLKRRREKLTDELREDVDKQKNETQKNVFKWFDKKIAGCEKSIINKLEMISKSMLTLANAERNLGLGYNKNHLEINKQILTNILISLGFGKTDLKKIVKVARVPGRKIVIVVKEKFIPASLMYYIGFRLGNKEEICEIYLDETKSQEAQTVYLLTKMGVECSAPVFKHVNDGNDVVAYVKDNNFTERDIDGIILVQQIMNIHIIIK